MATPETSWFRSRRQPPKELHGSWPIETHGLEPSGKGHGPRCPDVVCRNGCVRAGRRRREHLGHPAPWRRGGRLALLHRNRSVGASRRARLLRAALNHFSRFDPFFVPRWEAGPSRWLPVSVGGARWGARMAMKRPVSVSSLDRDLPLRTHFLSPGDQCLPQCPAKGFESGFDGVVSITSANQVQV